MRCKVCLSPYRGEIEELVKRGIYPMEIANKFYMLVGVSKLNLYNKIKNHTKRKHPPLLENNEPITPEQVENGVVDVSFKEYAGKLLKTAMNSEDMFNTKKLTHNQVIAAQRALIEESKVKTQENALKFAMVKFLRGEGVDGLKLVEGDTK